VGNLPGMLGGKIVVVSPTEGPLKGQCYVRYMYEYVRFHPAKCRMAVGEEKWKKGFKKQMLERYKEEEKEQKIKFYKASELALPEGGKLRIPPQNLWLFVHPFS